MPLAAQAVARSRNRDWVHEPDPGFFLRAFSANPTLAPHQGRKRSMPIRVTVPLIVVICLQYGCAPESAAPPFVWHNEASYRWRDLPVANGAHAGFTELSAKELGIRFVDDVPEDSVLQNRNLGLGSGVALGDVDGDGLVDIFLAKVGGPSALYRNLGN